jgi:hypothetical protein
MSSSEHEESVVPRDSTIVGVHEPRELEYWAGHFGVSAEEVRRAVMDVGAKVADVAFRLRQGKSRDR